MNALDPAIANNLQALMTHFDNSDTQRKNVCFTSAGLVIGSGSTAAVKIANTVTYLSGGIFASKSSAEVSFTATTHDIPASVSTIQECVYLITLSLNGTPTVTAGVIASGAGAALLPARPATGTPIGYVRIAVNAAAPGAGTNFVAGTTALSDARMTVTYYNVGVYGPRFDAVQ